MRVEDFNDLWMKELNGWQKDYFPHLKKEEYKNDSQEVSISESITFFKRLFSQMEENDSIVEEYPESNNILIFYEKPNLYPTFNINEAIKIANKSLNAMGLLPNVVFTIRAKIPKGIIIIGNNGNFFQRHEQGIKQMAQSIVYRFSRDIKDFANQTLEDGTVPETSTTFPSNSSYEAYFEEMFQNDKQQNLKWAVIKNMFVESKVSKRLGYDLGLIRFDLMLDSKKSIFQNDNNTENLAYTFLHVLGHNAGITHGEPNEGVMRYGSELDALTPTYKLKLTDIMYGQFANKTKEAMDLEGIKHNTFLKLEKTAFPGRIFRDLSNERYINAIKKYFLPRF